MTPLSCPDCHGTNLVCDHLRHNHSAFNGYHWTRSDYSQVRCLDCGRAWRTTSGQAADLPTSGLCGGALLMS